MKKLVFLMVVAGSTFVSVAQNNIGIGTTSPHPSAIVDMTSTNKGMLVPRMSSAFRLGIASPAKGLLVFDNTNSFWFHNGTAWAELPGGGGDATWQTVQDSIAYTSRPYVSINSDYALTGSQANLHVTGSLLAQGKLFYSNSNPTPAQTYTMDNTATIQQITDSVFRLYDPGGTGNYNNNMQGNIRLPGRFGYKISSVATGFGIGSGDTLWISDVAYPQCRTRYEHRFLSTSTNPDDLIVTNEDNNTSIYIIFRSNANGVNGPGFNFKVTKIYYPNLNQQENAALNTVGPTLQFSHIDGSLAAGTSVKTRNGGIAFGNGSQALGINSFAAGDLTRQPGMFHLLWV
ncbi:MAG TPA: hypothetical protein VGO58_13640 [Chitinophagaceae bacterium]|jgi:hypothetical protein|nr:hypothetical protein [Chitinophagaceae bacterium]